MPNEATYGSITDLATSEVLSGEFLKLYTSTEALPNHGALHYAGSIKGRGSNTIKIPHVGLGGGYNPLAAMGDGSAVPNTAISDASSLLVVQRQSLRREVSDLAGMVRPDILNRSQFAADSFDAYAARLTDMICDVIDGFNATAGQTGVNLALSDVLGAIGTAKGLRASGPWMGVLHTQQWSDFIQDAGLTSGGALQWSPATQEMLPLKTSAFQGTYLGVDWFVSARVVTGNAGADRAGAVFSKGAVCWGDGGWDQVQDPNNQYLLGGQMLYERKRTQESGLDAWITHAYLGVTKGVEHGVTLFSDA